jgi:transposase
MRKIVAERREVKAECGLGDIYVGIDVHKRSYSVALWSGGVIIKTWTSPANIEVLLNSLACYRSRIRSIVYEAGPTGFGLARRLRDERYSVCVAAPSQIPREAAPMNKTDRLDCRKLALYSGTGVLTKFVTVPTEEEEDDRQVVRLRGCFARKLRQVKQQIKSLLLQHGIEEPDGLEHWSNKALEELVKMKARPGVRFSLDILLSNLWQLKKELKEIDSYVEKIASSPRHKKRVEILRSHPGVGEVVAASFETEMFSGREFRNANEVGAFLGLAPRVESSGEKERRGHIMKRGNGPLRALLVQAAWKWIQLDPRARSRYGQLLHQTGEPNKSITAMARKLGIHLWRMLERGELYKAV